ncbi:MerR family transcriptional regulator [Spirochaeta cellobiosiphila]|uniref:MerR family transcriptional regulator n=1 Tax=Spirochaeta cellobiosiphila TaxID=504483 RepID=UPI0003FBE4D4|nr:MerR family transcriptional regulator [Spirochaeta cellobiosiphila]
MKYKPRDIQKILGVSVDTLRFFEGKGLLAPERDSQNNYRYFESTDLNKIMAYKLYRELEFNLEDSLSMVNKGNDFQIEKLKIQEEKIANKLKHYQSIQTRIKELLDDHENAIELNGKYRIVHSPEILIYYNQKNNEFDTSDKVLEANKVWIAHLPYIELSFYIQRDKKGLAGNINFGYALRCSNSVLAEKLKHHSSQRIPSQLCLHTVIQSSSTSPISTGHFSEALKYIEDNGYRLSGDITGWILNEEQKDTEKIQYFECWLPISEIA